MKNMLKFTAVVYFFIVLCQPTLAFYNLCQNPKNEILSAEECSNLHFDSNDKSKLGNVKLDFEKNVLKVQPTAIWNKAYLKVSMPQNSSEFCTKLSNNKPNLFCFLLKPELENRTFKLDYKIEKLPEISTRRLIFNLPGPNAPIFVYVDQTDSSRLILRGLQLSDTNTSYKVEAFKEKNGNTNFENLRIFSEPEFSFEFFTYNDVGTYYFVVSPLSECREDCPKIQSPKIFIGRKSTRVVIGIVGASFILPFILFIFHILTRKYPDNSLSDERIVLAFKSSTKKHNDIILAFASLLEKITTDKIIDVVDLSKSHKKFAEKFCVDSLIVASRIVYVSCPKTDTNNVTLEKSLTEKELFGVVFDYCSDSLPDFVPDEKIFRLFGDFDLFLDAVNVNANFDRSLCQDLIKKIEEAKIYPNCDLPKIVITESEPQECDALI